SCSSASTWCSWSPACSRSNSSWKPDPTDRRPYHQTPSWKVGSAVSIERLVGWLAAVLLALGLGIGLAWAPRDAVQGNVQRIMYVHVPAILTGYVAIAVVLVASVLYLWTRRANWDRVAAAGGGLVVCLIGLTLAARVICG